MVVDDDDDVLDGTLDDGSVVVLVDVVVVVVVELPSKHLRICNRVATIDQWSPPDPPLVACPYYCRRRHPSRAIHMLVSWWHHRAI